MKLTRTLSFLVFLACTPMSAWAIISGSLVDKSNPAARHVVFLYLEDKKEICSGTLIHPQVVLTAAHCVQTRENGVRVAFGLSPATGNYQKRVSKKILVHEDYNSSKSISRSDVALILLDSPAPTGYEKAYIPSQSFPLRADLSFTAIGYGRNLNDDSRAGQGVLRETTLKIEKMTLANIEFQVDQQGIGKGICSGDSGGPALMEYQGKNYVVGISSAIIDLDEASVPNCLQKSVFMNVVHFQEWINDGLNLLLHK